MNPQISTKFEFQSWAVYKSAIEFNQKAYALCHQINSSEFKELRNQLRRASQSIVLNIAEGSSRWTKADKLNFLRIARGSVFECVAILDLVKAIQATQKNPAIFLEQKLVSIGKMLSGFINYLETNKPERGKP